VVRILLNNHVSHLNESYSTIDLFMLNESSTKEKLMIFERAVLTALALTAGVAMAKTSPPPSVDPTNTGINERDSVKLTPEDQARGSAADVEATRAIRQRVVDDKTLSTKAHNVKIITLKGIATLRGPVETIEEKTRIEGHAKQAPGVNSVRNEIEVVR
jgi:hypothetical protein